MVDGVKLPDLLNFDVSFYEADIEVDAILSYPWMSANRLGIFPHHRALARDRTHFHPAVWEKKIGAPSKIEEDQIEFSGYGNQRLFTKWEPKIRRKTLYEFKANRGEPQSLGVADDPVPPGRTRASPAPEVDQTAPTGARAWTGSRGTRQSTTWSTRHLRHRTTAASNAPPGVALVGGGGCHAA